MGFAGGLLALAVVAGTLPPPMPAHYTLLCTPEQVIGFTWKNGAYVPEKYPPTAFIVTKEEEGQGCQPDHSADGVNDGLITKMVCLNEHDVGVEKTSDGTQECSEAQYAGINEGKPVLRCEGELFDFYGSADGIFHRSTLNSNVDEHPEKDYKDSQVIEVGRCRMAI